MAWIESHQQLLNHPKTLDLMNSMGWDVDITIGKLNRFWWWCLDYAPDGDLRRHKQASLAAAVGLPADQSKRFVRAMIQSGWMDRLPYFRVHNWWQYVGPFLQVKYKRHPQIWRRVQALYQQEGGYSNGTVAQNEGDSNGTNTQDERDSNDTEAHDGGDSNGTNAQDGRDSNVPPNLTKPNQPYITKPDLIKPDQPHQHHHRHGDVDESPANVIHAVPADMTPVILEQDLERMICERIGRNTPLSRLDLRKIEVLRNKHGPKFDRACEQLYGGVKNPPAYLRAILEPNCRAEELATWLQEMALTHGTAADTSAKGSSGMRSPLHSQSEKI